MRPLEIAGRREIRVDKLTLAERDRHLVRVWLADVASRARASRRIVPGRDFRPHRNDTSEQSGVAICVR